MVVEGQQFILALLVTLQFSFEGVRLGSIDELSLVIAVHTSVFMSVNADAMLFRDDVLVAEDLSSGGALKLVLFNFDKDLVRHSQVNESIHSSLVLLHQLSLSTVGGVVHEHEAILSSISESQKLERDLLFMEHVNIASVDHVSDLLEEGVGELFVGISFGGNTLHELMHVYDRHSHIDGEPKSQLEGSEGTYLIDTSSVKALGGPKNATLGATGHLWRYWLVCPE